MYSHGSTRWRNCGRHASIWDSAWDFCAASAYMHSQLYSWILFPRFSKSSLLISLFCLEKPASRLLSKWSEMRCDVLQYQGFLKAVFRPTFNKASSAESNSFRRCCCRLNSRSAAMPVTSHFWATFWAMMQWTFFIHPPLDSPCTLGPTILQV